MMEIQPPMYSIGGAVITIGHISVHKMNPKRNVIGGMVKTKTRPSVHIRKTIRIGIQRIKIVHPRSLGMIFVGFKSVEYDVIRFPSLVGFSFLTTKV